MASARFRSNSYEISVFCGLTSHGKRIYKYHYWTPTPGMTDKQIAKELEHQKMLFEDKVKNGDIINSTSLFRDFAERWMVEYAKPKLAPKTFSRYRDYLNRIIPAIGHIKLSELKPMHLNTFYRNLAEPGVNKHGGKGEGGKKPLAPKTIRDHHRVISKILSTAVKWELLDRNVAERADPPPVPYQERTILDEMEIKQMIFLLNGEPMQYRVMVSLLILTGMRRGELCGLEWKDIDFEKYTLSIRRSSQYIGNAQFITKEPKTKAGIRKITIGPNVCRLLEAYRTYQDGMRQDMGDRWVESDRLFTQRNGEPIYPDTITDWFPKFLAKHNLPKVTLHSLRHSNATLMIAEGVDIRTVSNRLGHAQTSTTLNIYSHALKSRDEDAAEKLDLVLNF